MVTIMYNTYLFFFFYVVETLRVETSILSIVYLLADEYGPMNDQSVTLSINTRDIFLNSPAADV